MTVRTWVLLIMACVAIVPSPVYPAEVSTLNPNPYGSLPSDLDHSATPARSVFVFRLLARREARNVGVPYDLIDAVIKIESSYDPARIGAVGEIGLMQVRPATASLLGFKGSLADLGRPEINVHYGAAYLGQAWHLANGDICRTLMKYRAGHNEEAMSPLSAQYCARARAHLAAMGSPLATLITAPVEPASPGAEAAKLEIKAGPSPAKTASSAAAWAKRAAKLRGKAFWIAEEAHVRLARQQVEAKWRRLASR